MVKRKAVFNTDYTFESLLHEHLSCRILIFMYRHISKEDGVCKRFPQSYSNDFVQT